MSSTVEALLREREGYLRRGLPGRVAEIDAALARYGVAVDDTPAPKEETAVTPPPAETAVTRRRRER